MINTKQHPADRRPYEAVAYTLEKGGTWIEGRPELGGAFHSLIFADGWVFDSCLCRKGIDRGARRAKTIPVFDENGISQPIVMDVRDFPSKDEKPHAEATIWDRCAEIEKHLADLDSRLARLESGAQRFRIIDHRC